MIKRIICAIWGHDTKNITIDDIFRIIMSENAFSFDGLDVRFSNLYGLNNNKTHDSSK